MYVQCACADSTAERQLVCMCRPFSNHGIWYTTYYYDPVRIVITFTHEHFVVIIAVVRMERTKKVREKYPKFQFDLLALFAYIDIFHNSLSNLLSLFPNSAQCTARCNTQPNAYIWELPPIKDFSSFVFFSLLARCILFANTVWVHAAHFNRILGWTLLYCHFGLMKSSRYCSNQSNNVW